PYTTLFRSKDIAMRRAHGHTKGVTNRIGAEHFVIANESRKNRQSRRVGARPSVGTPRVRVERKDRARSGGPLRAVPMQRVELEQDSMIAVDDQHVPVAVRIRIVAGEAAFDPLLLRLRLLRNRITKRPAGSGEVALVVVIERR